MGGDVGAHQAGGGVGPDVHVHGAEREQEVLEFDGRIRLAESAAFGGDEAQGAFADHAFGFDHDGLIFSAIAVGFDTLHQRQTRFGAQLHVLQALEQLQSSQHSGLRRYRDKAHGVDADV